MKAQDSEHIMSGFAGMFPTVGFLNYEMITPDDRFGQQMVENIEMRGCSLLGLNDCPSTQAQIERMQRILQQSPGHVQVESITMDVIYSTRLDVDKERTRIEKLEMFDEWEEWNLLQAHYCLTLATRSTAERDLNTIQI